MGQCCGPPEGVPRLVWARLMRTEFVQAVRRFTPALVCVYVLQMLSAYSYFILSAVLVQYLSRNLGMSDTQASLVYMAFGILVSLTGMVFGLMIDQMGTFSAVMFGAVVSLLGKAFLLVAPLAASSGTAASVLTVVLLMTLVPFGETVMGQALGIGIKRYAVTGDGAVSGTRSIEFSLNYSLQNVAALLAYASISIANAAYDGAPDSEVYVNRVALALALPSMVLTFVGAGLGLNRWDTYDIDAAVARREDEMLADENIRAEEQAHVKLSACASFWEKARPRWMSRVFSTGATGSLLARYLVVALLLTGSKSLFRHLEATLPKYVQREFDPNYSYALLLMINPAAVILLTALVQSWLTRYEPLRVIIAGTLIASAGAFFFMIPHLAGAYIAVIIITLGEIVWSPRFVDYAYQLAPQGQEGAFGSASVMPLFLAKLPTGLMSGYLLNAYCPEGATPAACDGPALWGIIAAFTLASPLLLVVVYRWVTHFNPDTVASPEDTTTQTMERVVTENLASPVPPLRLSSWDGSEPRIDDGSGGFALPRVPEPVVLSARGDTLIDAKQRKQRHSAKRK